MPLLWVWKHIFIKSTMLFLCKIYSSFNWRCYCLWKDLMFQFIHKKLFLLFCLINLVASVFRLQKYERGSSCYKGFRILFGFPFFLSSFLVKNSSIHSISCEKNVIFNLFTKNISFLQFCLITSVVLLSLHLPEKIKINHLFYYVQNWAFR